jgi:polygalacturonase
MKDVAVPISISPFYNGQTTDGIVDLGMKGDRIPDYKEITFENVLSLTAGIVQIAGLNADHRTEVTLNGVDIRDIRPDQVRAQFARITIGPLGSNLKFSGNGVTSTPASAPLKMSFSCEGKFVPYRD